MPIDTVIKLIDNAIKLQVDRPNTRFTENLCSILGGQLGQPLVILTALGAVIVLLGVTMALTRRSANP